MTLGGGGRGGEGKGGGERERGRGRGRGREEEREGEGERGGHTINLHIYKYIYLATEETLTFESTNLSLEPCFGSSTARKEGERRERVEREEVWWSGGEEVRGENSQGISCKRQEEIQGQ